jgi:hypothetical protein
LFSSLSFLSIRSTRISIASGEDEGEEDREGVPKEEEEGREVITIKGTQA